MIKNRQMTAVKINKATKNHRKKTERYAKY